MAERFRHYPHKVGKSGSTPLAGTMKCSRNILEFLAIPAIFIGIFVCFVAEIIAMGIYLLTGLEF